MRITAAIAVAFCVMLGVTRMEAQKNADDVPVTAAGRLRTTSEGWIYLMYETCDGLKPHPDSNAAVARFNLSWVLNGESTGDGDVPQWVTKRD